MSPQKIIGIVLIALGILALVYGGFSYTKTTNEVNIGDLNLSMDKKETINIPVWAGIGGIIIGGVLVAVPKKR